MMLLRVILLLLALPALAATGYLALLTVMSWRSRPPAPTGPRLRFDVVVPAHDEESGIARTVRSLLALEWPRELFRVIVVADNCTDRTAKRAAEAGAVVLVRNNLTRRGKGYALQFAFEHLLAEGKADAVVVVDADTLVSPNLLAAFASRLEAGALAAQAHNAVLNCHDSWRTQLMALAFALFNDLRSLGRERLGVSCGLRGNGMCISKEALLRVPHEAFSIVEDLEYGIRLGYAGIRVAYAHDARVQSEMVSSERASRSQRRRWESGRGALMHRHGPDLFREAVRRRSAVLLDMALDIFVPPLSWVAAYTGFGTAAAIMLSIGNGAPVAALWCWGAGMLFLVAYVLRGVQLSGLGVRGLACLAWAPGFIVWKAVILATRPVQESKEFIRTTREPGTTRPT